MPSNLIVELTESMAVNGGDVDQYSLNGLRRLGVQLEIDDFGTGYSSISYLRKLPVNVVKIDRSLISGLGRRRTAAGFRVRGAASYSCLRPQSAGRGHRDRGTGEVLREMGCGSGQGYYFGRPVPAADGISGADSLRGARWIWPQPASLCQCGLGGRVLNSDRRVPELLPAPAVCQCSLRYFLGGVRPPADGLDTEPCPELSPVAEIAAEAERPAAASAPATRSVARVFFMKGS